MSKSHATLRYTSMRTSIFGACFVIALVLAHFRILPVTAGASGVFLLLLLAGIVSAPLSYVVLSRQRDAMSAQITTGIEQRQARPRSMKSRFAAQAAEEDAIDDAVRSQQA
ncbi:DUF4229 domain-containing protein [Streptacidiphilus sp. P02-A3a]|uniref:DUF4229 domain-containing protein n=1 Tax=Streptacidiphilus sp. P02-A3a TaxID=2704468 RepID=UPI001CDCED1A|nr:DUF4229 domain-containing protein [Streptacidiphilus sp. P02-A3a]